MPEKLLSRVVVNPRVMAGKPIIRGTRITVEQILRLLGQGLSVEEILAEYPYLTEEDVRAALLYAAEALSREVVIPLIEGFLRPSRASIYASLWSAGRRRI